MNFDQKTQYATSPRVTYELNILIGGKPITEYQHEGNCFVEGRKGSEFEVEFKNRSNNQVLIVPSVDGKSIFDGKPATPDSQGYVVRAYGSIRIPGWTLDSNAVAKFTFEDKDKSYSAAVTQEGDAVVSGVIGVMVYAEKPQPKSVVINQIQHISPYYTYNGTPRTPWPYPGPMLMGTSTSADSIPKSVMRGMSNDSVTLSASAQSANHENTSMADSAPFEMGAGFGQKSDFKTTTVSFERGEIQATMVIYYDSRRNLEKRGIQVVKKETRHLNDLPQAFQGTGCTPPPGWQG